MKSGAVALFDCLGFKGIWDREKDTPVLVDRLLNVEQKVMGLLAMPEESNNRLPTITNVRLLSDTVAISVFASEDLDPDDQLTGGRVIAEACRATAAALSTFLNGQPLLVMRGCVTYGPHLFKNNFLIGPAVDTAAELMEIAAGGFVWLHPKAAQMYRSALEERHELRSRDYPSVIDFYEVPMKGGGELRCAVVNPFVFFDSPPQRQAIIESYSNMMDNRPETWLKHQYTLDFLKIANQKCNDYEEQWSKLQQGSKSHSDSLPE